MTKSISRDVQLLLAIRRYQFKIIDYIKWFKRVRYDSEHDSYMYDMCGMYILQVGELCKNLSDSTKESFRYFDVRCLIKNRNLVAHVYDKIDVSTIESIVNHLISDNVIKEVLHRINYCKSKVSKH